MNLYECIDKFTDMEKNAVDIYKKIEDLSQADVKDTAIRFEKEEGRHIEFLNNLKSKIENIEMNPEIEKFIESIKEEEKGGENFSRKDFFLMALQGEKNSINIYQMCKIKFPENTEGHKLFSLLVEEEKSHMLYILKQNHL